MSAETLIILGILLLFFGLTFGAVYSLPILITKWRASFFGLSLTIRQAKVITKANCNKKEFLLPLKEILFWADIPIEKLTLHFQAGGDMENIKNGIVEMRQKNQDIDFSILSTFDLAGRDLKDEIKKAELNNWTFILTD